MELILRAYGSDATWNDVVRIAIVRLIDLAEISTEKAAELGKPRLRDEAEMPTCRVGRVTIPTEEVRFSVAIHQRASRPKASIGIPVRCTQ